MKMVKAALIFGLFVVSKHDGFTQVSTPAVDQYNSQVATVCFYQSTPHTWIPVKYRLYDQGKSIGKLNRHSHREVQLMPGTHTLATKIAYPWVGFGPKPSLTLTLEAGKTYYIQGDEKLDLWPLQSILSLTEVVPNAAKLREINKSRADQPIIISSLNR